MIDILILDMGDIKCNFTKFNFSIKCFEIWILAYVIRILYVNIFFSYLFFIEIPFFGKGKSAL